MIIATKLILTIQISALFRLKLPWMVVLFKPSMAFITFPSILTLSFIIVFIQCIQAIFFFTPIRTLNWLIGILLGSSSEILNVMSIYTIMLFVLVEIRTINRFIFIYKKVIINLILI